MSKKILCGVCNKPMKNLGNISCVVLASYPPQWDEVYICETDKTKKTVRVHGALLTKVIDIGDYKEQP